MGSGSESPRFIVSKMPSARQDNPLGADDSDDSLIIH